MKKVEKLGYEADSNSFVTYVTRPEAAMLLQAWKTPRSIA